MTKILPIEKDVLDMLLAGEDKYLSILRKQLEGLSVAERELTGAGFYTTFNIPKTSEKIVNRPSFAFGDVEGEISGLEFGAGFVLWIKDGALDMLEGYSFEEPWPDEILNYELKYSSGVYRDMDFIKSVLPE